MCLLFDRYKSDLTKQKIKERLKSRTFWKILKVYRKSITSIFFTKKWVPGWNHCDRVRIHNATNTVHNAIHVYTNKPCNTIGILVKVTVNPKDLIEFSSRLNEAAFKKVYLSKKEYRRVLRRRNS